MRRGNLGAIVADLLEFCLFRSYLSFKLDDCRLDGDECAGDVIDGVSLLKHGVHVHAQFLLRVFDLALKTCDVHLQFCACRQVFCSIGDIARSSLELIHKTIRHGSSLLHCRVRIAHVRENSPLRPSGPQYDQRCRLTDSAAPEMPARSSGYICVLIWPVPLLTIALPVTPISLFRFRKTSSIVSPHAPLVLFRQAHVPTKKGGLPVSYFHCRDDEMQVNCREAAHLTSGHCVASMPMLKAPASFLSSQRLACQGRHFLVQLPCKIPHARDSGVFRIAVLRKLNERR